MKQAEVLFFAKGSKLNIQDVPLIKFHNVQHYNRVHFSNYFHILQHHESSQKIQL